MNFSEIKVDLTNPSSTVPPTIHDKPITDLPLKTPISFLQEICFRIHATPSYSLCPSEAQCSANEPSFLYRVVVDDMIAFGKGSSKKRAKHKAAWSMIEQCYAKLKLVEDPLIKTIEQYFALKPLHSSTTNEDVQVNGEKSNPIGKLQELTQKNWIRPPEYEFSDQENVPTNNSSKTYICRAKVASYSAEGTGLSKKLAKRQAATNLLNLLENLDEEEKKKLFNRSEGQNESESGQNQSKYRRSRRKGNDSSLVENGAGRLGGLSRSARNYDKCSFTLMKISDLPEIRKLLTSEESPSLDESLECLENLAKEQNFTFEFIQLPSVDANSFPVLLELRLSPVSVFHGCDPNFLRSQQKAANAALLYIRYVTKQQIQTNGTTLFSSPIVAQNA